MLRKSCLLALVIGSAASATPHKSPPQGSSMILDESLSATDPVAVRDHQRGAQARWFVVGIDNDSMYLVDRRTLQRRGAVRTGWTMAFRFASGKILMRAAIHQNWDCSKRTATELALQTYDENGTPDPMQTTAHRSEAIVPDTVGEDAFNFVCDRPARGDTLPMPLSRSPVSAGQILAAYAEGSGVSVFGLLLATLNPSADEARLKSMLEFEKPDKRVKLTPLIFDGTR